ncbi:MAG: hypothetical protein A2698_00115 [Candidatus Levybacteria bacterium RIFCSPHIGHO2_01_FULL_42_15]|nr:MAG: hypothetical protein A2698_00115 [Candidatus Levybacteria bacterium RIFCSPHIGHO2_01_FULL_42_15]
MGTRRELFVAAGILALTGCESNRSFDSKPAIRNGVAAIATPSASFAQGVRNALVAPEAPVVQDSRPEATPPPRPLPTMDTLYVRGYVSQEEIRRASVHTPEQRKKAQEQFIRLNEYLLNALQKNQSFAEFVKKNQLRVLTRLLAGDQIGVVTAPYGVLAKVFPMNQEPQHGPGLSLVEGTIVRWNTDVVLINPNVPVGAIQQVWISSALPANSSVPVFYPRQLGNDQLITLYPGSTELNSVQTALVSPSEIEYVEPIK